MLNRKALAHAMIAVAGLRHLCRVALALRAAGTLAVRTPGVLIGQGRCSSVRCCSSVHCAQLARVTAPSCVACFMAFMADAFSAMTELFSA